MKRHIVFSLLSACCILALTITGQQRRGSAAFSVVEASIPDMQKAMKDGRVTSRELVVQYLTRIATYEDKLHAALAVNPNAIKEAEQLDRERARGKLRGPLHGIPIALKDNILTTSLPTTGGETAKLMADAIAVLKQQGAVVVDPADIPSVAEKDPQNNFNSFGICQATQGRGKDENCSIVFKYGMKRDFNKFLASLGPSAPVKTLTELREWNLAHQKAGAIKFGQSLLDVSDEMDVERDRARYEADRAKDLRLAATHGLVEAIQTNKLDALIFPGANLNAIAAKSGYPVVVVPFGMVPNAPNNAPFPPGFNAKPGPFGVSFVGTACSEPKVLTVAYGFEQATKRRVPPPGAP